MVREANQNSFQEMVQQLFPKGVELTKNDEQEYLAQLKDDDVISQSYQWMSLWPRILNVKYVAQLKSLHTKFRCDIRFGMSQGYNSHGYRFYLSDPEWESTDSEELPLHADDYIKRRIEIFFGLDDAQEFILTKRMWLTGLDSYHSSGFCEACGTVRAYKPGTGGPGKGVFWCDDSHQIKELSPEERWAARTKVAMERWIG